MPKTEFLNLCTMDILGQTILCCGSSPVHCELFSSVLGFQQHGSPHPHPWVVTTKNVCRHCQMSPQGQSLTLLRTTTPKDKFLKCNTIISANTINSNSLKLLLNIKAGCKFSCFPNYHNFIYQIRSTLCNWMICKTIGISSPTYYFPAIYLLKQLSHLS